MFGQRLASPPGSSRPSVAPGGGSNGLEQPVKILGTRPACPKVGTDSRVENLGVLTPGHHVGVAMQDGHCLVASHVLRVCAKELLQFRPLRQCVSIDSM